MIIPASLHHLERTDSGRAWLRSLPELLERSCRRWQLELDAAYASGGASYVAAGRDAAGIPVVLKLQYPHHECRDEAAALRAWNGNGAVRLIDHHAGDHALLLEHCTPGTMLTTCAPGEALEVLCAVLPKLLAASGDGFQTLDEETVRWRATLLRALVQDTGHAVHALIETTLQVLDELGESRGPQSLVHQDLHGDNVILSAGRGWLAIDPKPLSAEREFAVAPVVRSSELGHTRPEAVGRLDTLCEHLNLDRERARKWTIVQTVAWGTWFEDPAYARKHADVARWMLEA